MQMEIALRKIFEEDAPTLRICFKNPFTRDHVNGDYLVEGVRIPKALVKEIYSGKELLFVANCYFAPYIESKGSEEGIMLGVGGTHSIRLAATQIFIPNRLMYKYADAKEKYPGGR